MMLLSSAHADMPTPPKVDTNWTAPSLILTVNGNTVRSFSTHGLLSAAKGSLTTVSRSDIRLIQYLDSSALWSDGPEDPFSLAPCQTLRHDSQLCHCKSSHQEPLCAHALSLCCVSGRWRQCGTHLLVTSHSRLLRSWVQMLMRYLALLSGFCDTVTPSISLLATGTRTYQSRRARVSVCCVRAWRCTQV
jgi:hypothetical protein